MNFIDRLFFTNTKIPKDLIERMKTQDIEVPSKVSKVLENGNHYVPKEIIDNLDQFHPKVQERLRNLFTELGFVDKLSVDIGSECEEDRLYALETLGKIGTGPSIDILITTMADKKEELSLAAARSLGNVKGVNVVYKLIDKQLDNPGLVLPARIADVLISQGTSSVMPLLKALPRINDMSVKATFIEILGELGDKKTVPIIIEELKSGVAEIQEKAAIALGVLLDSNAVEPLIAALDDINENVRAAAAYSLGILQDTRAISGLREVLHDEAWKVRINSIEALARIGRESVSVFEEVVNEENYPEKERIVKIIKELEDAS